MSFRHIKTEVKTEEEDVGKISGGFLCPSCGAHYFSEEYFIEHVREHHPIPEQLLQSQDKEPRVLNKFVENTGHEQQGCNCEVNGSDVVKSEVKTDLREENGLTCSDCGDKFLEEDNFVDHVRKHVHGKLVRTKHVQPRDEESTHLKLNSKTHTGDQPFKCSKCSFAAARKSDLKKHLRIHTGDKPFKCSECSYAAALQCTLKKHLRTHTGEKPYKCSECSYAAAQKYTLTDHLMTHTGEKPYKCSECSFAAAHKSHLKIHIRRHTGEKPFKCSECSFAAALQSGLTKHIRTHTGEKPFKCSECSFAAAQQSGLTKHLRTHTGEKPFK